jgi:hypothetical protein
LLLDQEFRDDLSGLEGPLREVPILDSHLNLSWLLCALLAVPGIAKWGDCKEKVPLLASLALGRDGGPWLTAATSAAAVRARLEYRFDLPFKLVPQARREAFLAFCPACLSTNRGLFHLERNAC